MSRSHRKLVFQTAFSFVWFVMLIGSQLLPVNKTPRCPRALSVVVYVLQYVLYCERKAHVLCYCYAITATAVCVCRHPSCKHMILQVLLYYTEDRSVVLACAGMNNYLYSMQQMHTKCITVVYILLARRYMCMVLISSARYCSKHYTMLRTYQLHCMSWYFSLV
jgi:hypothetical protein